MEASIGNPCYVMAAFQLRGSDARALLGFATDLAECRTAAQLDERMAAIPDLIGADAVVVADCREWARGFVLEFGDPGVYRSELLAAIAPNWRDHPVLTRDLARATRSAHMISDFITSREWRRRVLFNDLYRPLGMTRELAIQLSWGPAGSSCCVTLHRAGREFSERDRLALELLAPHLRAARARIAAEAGAAQRPPRSRPSAEEPLSAASLAQLLPITLREAEVLACLATGATNDGIGHELGISRHTVARHVEHVYGKLGVRTRAAATRAALEAIRRGSTPGGRDLGAGNLFHPDDS